MSRGFTGFLSSLFVRLELRVFRIDQLGTPCINHTLLNLSTHRLGMSRFTDHRSVTNIRQHHGLPTFKYLSRFKLNSLPPANEVWGKVIFSDASVILFTGGEGVVLQGGQPRGGAASRGSASRGGLHPVRGVGQTPPGIRKAGSTHPL